MSDKLSFVLYEKSALPRYYEMNKKIFHMALYGFPGIALVSLAGALLMGIYIKETRGLPLDKSAPHPSPLLEKNKALTGQNQKLQNVILRLQTKLAAAPTSPQIGNAWIESPANSKKVAKTSLSIESHRTFIKNNRLHFHFNLSNKLKNQTRLRGFVHVIMKKGNGLFFWPPSGLPPQKLSAPYNNGEPFSTRYFRPVTSVFPLPADGSDKYVFFVTVHGVTGDLLHHERIDPTAGKAEAP